LASTDISPPDPPSVIAPIAIASPSVSLTVKTKPSRSTLSPADGSVNVVQPPSVSEPASPHTSSAVSV